MKLPLNDIEIIFSRIRKQLTETVFAKSLPLNIPEKNIHWGKEINAKL
jgi:hypothetical protein